MRPSDSPIKLTAAQETEVSKLASVEEISAYLRNCAVDQGLVHAPDPWAPDLLVDKEITAPKAFSRTVTIQGKNFVLEGASEGELDRQEISARQAAEAHVTDAPAKRDENGRFVKTTTTPEEEQQRAVDQVALEMSYKRGEITTADFLEQSGKIKEYLDQTGVTEIVEQHQGAKETQSWADATTRFLNSDAGANWPGSEANKNQLGKIIQEFQNAEGVPLADLPNKQEAIELAWAYMQSRPELISENPEVALTQKLAGAKSRREIDDALGISARLNHQQIWNAR